MANQQVKREGIKAREVVMVVLALGLLSKHLFEIPMIATLAYSFASFAFNLDSDIVQVRNFNGEVESEVFTHRFIDVHQTYRGDPVNVTYHYVECGNKDAEPIIFLHGLAETWKVWKEVMKPFCDKYHAIAFDTEGMGQSVWHDFDISENTKLPIKQRDLRSFYGDLQMQAITQIGIKRFNLVNLDYSFWSAMTLLHAYGPNVIIRYGKFQSTTGGIPLVCIMICEFMCVLCV